MKQRWRCLPGWRRRDRAQSGYWRRRFYPSCHNASFWMRGRKRTSRLWVCVGVVAITCHLTDAVADQDSFLPSAIQRYHQLFMPALQLVVAMLASLGTRHTTANNQVCECVLLNSLYAHTSCLHKALEFLSSHRDTVVIMLKNDSEEVALSFIEELHLLLSLTGSLLPLVPKSELASLTRIYFLTRGTDSFLRSRQ